MSEKNKAEQELTSASGPLGPSGNDREQEKSAKMRPLFYDRDGKPLEDTLEWARMFEKGGKRVAETALADGTWISTVWLGLDHGWGSGPPLIFETMVFLPDGSTDECERYSTETEAKVGHEEVVARWREKVSRPVAPVAEGKKL